MSVGQVSGLALVAAAQAGCPVIQYSPNEVKLAVTGYGSATKQQVQSMVRSLLDLDETPRPADRADALALAICHLTGAGLRRAVGAGTVRSQRRDRRGGHDRLPARRDPGSGDPSRPGRRSAHRGGRGGIPGARPLDRPDPDRAGRDIGLPACPHPRPRGCHRAVRVSFPRRAVLLRGADRRPRRRSGGGPGPALGSLTRPPSSERCRATTPTL